MNETYRLPRSQRWNAWGFLVFFTVWIGAIAVLAATETPTSLPLPGLAFSVSAPLLTWCPCICWLLEIQRHTLVVTDSHVESHGVWTRRRIALDDVREARWQQIFSGRAG